MVYHSVVSVEGSTYTYSEIFWHIVVGVMKHVSSFLLLQMIGCNAFVCPHVDRAFESLLGSTNLIALFMHQFGEKVSLGDTEIIIPLSDNSFGENILFRSFAKLHSCTRTKSGRFGIPMPESGQLLDLKLRFLAREMIGLDKVQIRLVDRHNLVQRWSRGVCHYSEEIKLEIVLPESSPLMFGFMEPSFTGTCQFNDEEMKSFSIGPFLQSGIQCGLPSAKMISIKLRVKGETCDTKFNPISKLTYLQITSIQLDNFVSVLDPHFDFSFLIFVGLGLRLSKL